LKDVSSFLCNTGSRYVSHFAAELDGDTEKDGFGLDYGAKKLRTRNLLNFNV